MASSSIYLKPFTFRMDLVEIESNLKEILTSGCLVTCVKMN